MDVRELIEKKRRLERVIAEDIGDLMQQFYKETGYSIIDVRVNLALVHNGDEHTHWVESVDTEVDLT